MPAWYFLLTPRLSEVAPRPNTLLLNRFNGFQRAPSIIQPLNHRA